MLTHSAIADVVVVGRPCERWGDEVVVVVELAPGAAVDDGDLLKAAGRRVASYKLPKAIVRVAKVVRGPAGKPDYPWARRIARAALAESTRHEERSRLGGAPRHRGG